MAPPIGAELLRDLFAHMEWAEAAVWRAIRATAGSADDELLDVRLRHSYGVARAFLHVWHGEDVDFGVLMAERSLDELQPLVREYHDAVRATTFNDARLADDVRLPWAAWLEERIGRAAAPLTYGEAMYQSVSHATYHRGQINARIRELGGTPPLVDYIAWVLSDRPRAEW
ncbi:MAG TPA: DinB family protein [Thermoanaerobaculia bacterium]|jgi:uncharacterized damage-inducible protein DinB